MPRAQYGENNGRAVLTDAEADLVRGMVRARDGQGKRVYTHAELAEKFDVSKSTIEKIANGRRRP